MLVLSITVLVVLGLNVLLIWFGWNNNIIGKVLRVLGIACILPIVIIQKILRSL